MLPDDDDGNAAVHHHHRRPHQNHHGSHGNHGDGGRKKVHVAQKQELRHEAWAADTGQAEKHALVGGGAYLMPPVKGHAAGGGAAAPASDETDAEKAWAESAESSKGIGGGGEAAVALATRIGACMPGARRVFTGMSDARGDSDGEVKLFGCGPYVPWWLDSLFVVLFATAAAVVMVAANSWVATLAAAGATVCMSISVVGWVCLKGEAGSPGSQRILCIWFLAVALVVLPAGLMAHGSDSAGPRKAPMAVAGVGVFVLGVFSLGWFFLWF